MAGIGTIYKAKKAAATAVDPTSAVTFLQSDDSTKAAVVYFPVFDSSVKNATFRFRAIGHATTSGSHNVTPAVCYGVSATYASNTSIAAASARAVATTTATWVIEGLLFWDATAKTLNGLFHAVNGSTATADTDAVTTAVSSVDLTSAGKGLSVAITIATGGGDYGYLDDFTLEVL